MNRFSLPIKNNPEITLTKDPYVDQTSAINTSSLAEPLWMVNIGNVFSRIQHTHHMCNDVVITSLDIPTIAVRISKTVIHLINVSNKHE